MWLSKQMKPGAPTSGADMGVTTISGRQVGVMTRGEVRDLPVYGPGGYLWAPANGTAVLVVRGGPGGEEQCVAGARPLEETQQIEPGEVLVYGPGGYLWTPANGAAVLVVKGGPGGEEQCVAGARPLEETRQIEPGEVLVYGPGGNTVYLRRDGGVEIRGERLVLAGEVSVEGKLTVNGAPYAPPAE